MLQNIRDHAHGWWTWVLVPLLILLFAMWGIGNYLGGSMSGANAAKVNGEAISLTQFSSMYEAMRRGNPQAANPGALALLKHQVLQTLVDQSLLTQALIQLGFNVDDKTIADLIYSIPAFQDQGQFSMVRYQAVLQNVGQTTESVKADLRQSYLIQQFQTGLEVSQFALPSEMVQEARYANMLRDVQILNLNLTQFSTQATPSEAAIASYYEAHVADYQTPLQVQVQYVLLKQTGDAAAYQAALNTLANVSFQYASSLRETAQQLHLAVENTGLLNTAHPTGILATPAVLQAVLSDSVLKQGNNSAVIPLSPASAVVVRVLTSVAPKPLPLSSVKNLIKQQLAHQNAVQALNASVNGILLAVGGQGESFEQVAALNHLQLTALTDIGPSSSSLPPLVLGEALKMRGGEVKAIPTATGVTLLRLARVYPPAKLSAVVPATTLQHVWLQIEESQFLQGLQQKSSVKINPALSQ
jgi:hypothetical protein